MPESKDDDYVVRNCPTRLKFECPRKWHLLKETGVAGVRHCDSCNNEVHYCANIYEAEAASFAGFCVAIDARLDEFSDFPEQQPEEDDFLIGLY